MPPNDPHWKLRAYTKRPLQHVFLNAPDICRRNVGTSWRCEYHLKDNRHHDELSLSVLCILWPIHIFTWIYFLNAIEVAWENHRAWVVATDVPRLGLRNRLGRFGAGLRASSTPNHTLSCSVTLGHPGIPSRSVALQGPVSPVGTSALGTVDDKTVHGVLWN